MFDPNILAENKFPPNYEHKDKILSILAQGIDRRMIVAFVFNGNDNTTVSQELSIKFDTPAVQGAIPRLRGIRVYSVYTRVEAIVAMREKERRMGRDRRQ